MSVAPVSAQPGAHTPDPSWAHLLESKVDSKRTPILFSMRHITRHRRPIGLSGLRKRINSLGSGVESPNESFAPLSDKFRTTQGRVNDASAVRMIAEAFDGVRLFRRNSRFISAFCSLG